MKKRSFLMSVVVLFLIVVVSNLSAQQEPQFIETMGDYGSINWTSGVVEAVGIGAPPERFYGKPQARPMAIRAAQMDAYRKLLEVTGGVRVDSMTLVKNYSVESDLIRSQVSGIVKGAEMVKTDYLSDGTVEVTVRMPLHGATSLGTTIYPHIFGETLGQAPAPATPAPPASIPSVTVKEASTTHTGLVVDARGIQARPAMSPKIIDEDGQEVYGTMQVNREFAIQQGMSGYSRDVKTALDNTRVTDNPLTVKGLRTDGPGKSNIIVSNQAAEQIRASSGSDEFLKKCRVMIVLD
ncbi:MAG: hypothetical protein JXB42_08685 [Deltaproteobacteria bacterium]|nr:hypothetical protein [Deltaproteobacteria bacterium]